MPPVRIYPIHDHALTVEFSLPIGLEAHELVMWLQQRLQESPLNGQLETVPAYNSLAVYLNNQTNWMEANRELEMLLNKLAGRKVTEIKTSTIAIHDLSSAQSSISTPIFTIPVCYDTQLASDLEMVCKTLSLSTEQLIEIHSQKLYTVFMTGFVPGFPYLGELDESLVIPRKNTPAARVPAGSVAIAGKQTGIYPFEVPGGWQIIGRTPLLLFDKRKEPCCLLDAGMKVKFEPIDLLTFQNWQ